MSERRRKGVKGMFPLGCLPLWGREGVTLIDVPKERKVRGFLQDQFIKELFKQPVVGRFVRDQDIMWVTLGHAGIGDPDKLCVLLHLADSRRTRIPHC
jgi:hypothetical protein